YECVSTLTGRLQFAIIFPWLVAGWLLNGGTLMSRESKKLSVVIWSLFFVVLSLVVPPFTLIWMPVLMLFERSPERVVMRDQAIAQAICDYQNEHGLLPETLNDLAPNYLP